MNIIRKGLFGIVLIGILFFQEQVFAIKGEQVEVLLCPYGQENVQYLSFSQQGEIHEIYGKPKAVFDGFEENLFSQIISEEVLKIDDSHYFETIFGWANELIEQKFDPNDDACEVGRFFIRYQGIEKWWYYTVRAPEIAMDFLGYMNTYTTQDVFWSRWDPLLAAKREQEMETEALRIYYKLTMGDERKEYEFVINDDGVLIISEGRFSNYLVPVRGVGWYQNYNKGEPGSYDFMRSVFWQKEIQLDGAQLQELNNMAEQALYDMQVNPSHIGIIDSPELIISICGNAEYAVWDNQYENGWTEGVEKLRIALCDYVQIDSE